MKKLESPSPHFHTWMPAAESQCVWMTAGILTYKLCNRDLDCERCLLHLALTADDLELNLPALALAVNLTKTGPVQ